MGNSPAYLLPPWAQRIKNALDAAFLPLAPSAFAATAPVASTPDQTGDPGEFDAPQMASITPIQPGNPDDSSAEVRSNLVYPSESDFPVNGGRDFPSQPTRNFSFNRLVGGGDAIIESPADPSCLPDDIAPSFPDSIDTQQDMDYDVPSRQYVNRYNSQNQNDEGY